MLIPKPKEWPNQKRKRDIKRKDRLLQESIGEGSCENCGKFGQLIGHHLKGRRFLEARWDLKNLKLLCACCHILVHSNRRQYRKKRDI